jgi:hypothetical protein
MTPAAPQPASPAQAENPASNNWQVVVAGTAQVVIHSAPNKRGRIDKHKSGRRAMLFDFIRISFTYKKTLLAVFALFGDFGCPEQPEYGARSWTRTNAP